MYSSIWSMEMDYVTEYPHSYMDRRPKKRPRLDWDPSHTPKVHLFFLLSFFVFLLLLILTFFFVRSFSENEAQLAQFLRILIRVEVMVKWKFWSHCFFYVFLMRCCWENDKKLEEFWLHLRMKVLVLLIFFVLWEVWKMTEKVIVRCQLKFLSNESFASRWRL